MKRNMVPLLGIAFVVAIISTGVFYGLFAGKLRSSIGDVPGQPVVVAVRDLQRGAVLTAADLRVLEVNGSLSGSFSKPEQAVGATLLSSLKQNEPVLEDRVVTKDPPSGQRHGSVPAGMRAISMRVSDSEGLLGFLRPGARVDVQAVLDRNGIVQLRTVLQNVEILALNSQTQLMSGISGPVFNVTVLTDAATSDLAALVDSGSHLRIALRNPLDSVTASRRSLALAAAFQSKDAAPDPAPRVAASTASVEPGLEIRVQVLDASSAAMEEINAKLIGSQGGDSLRVSAFPSLTDAGEMLDRLAAKHELEIVSARSLDTAQGSSVSFRAGSGACRLRVQFAPEAGNAGKRKLRVAPEIRIETKDGIETSTYSADMPGDGSFLIKGILDAPSDRAALEGLFPGHSWSNRSLAIFVTAGAAKAGAPVLAQRTQGR
jgi:Flp pilus assembly protein CpaB